MRVFKRSNTPPPALFPKLTKRLLLPNSDLPRGTAWWVNGKADEVSYGTRRGNKLLNTKHIFQLLKHCLAAAIPDCEPWQLEAGSGSNLDKAQIAAMAASGASDWTSTRFIMYQDKRGVTQTLQMRRPSPRCSATSTPSSAAARPSPTSRSASIR